MAIKETETVLYFRKKLAEASELPEKVCNHAQRILDIGSQGLTKDENSSLESFALNELSAFNFIVAERNLFRQLDAVVGSHLARLGQKIESKSEINFFALAEELIQELHKLKNIELYLDSDFNQLRNRICNRFDVDFFDLDDYLRNRRNKIEEMIRTENADIINDLIKRTPDLFREFKDMVNRQRKAETVITIYETQDGKKFISAVDAHKLDIYCNTDYHWLNLNEYSFIKDNYQIVTAPANFQESATADAPTEENKKTLTEISIYSFNGYRYYIPTEVAIELGFTVTADDEWFLLSQEQKDMILKNYFVDFKRLQYPIREHITIYTDQDGDKYITIVEAQKLSIFPLQPVDSYHLLRESELQFLRRDFKIDNQTIALTKKTEPKEEKNTGSVEEETTARPVTMIYVGPDGRLYRQVPMSTNKVIVDEVQDELSPDDMTSLMEIADIVWITFDKDGTLSDAPATQIDAIVNYYLGRLCTITEVSNTNNVHRYNVEYTITGGPLSTDKII